MKDSVMAAQLAFVGAGHVGLVSAACMASIGHSVGVYDIDEGRIRSLRDGRAPFFEPGLQELLESLAGTGRLSFHSNPPDALGDADIVFLCVDTPNDAEGNVDLGPLVSAVRDAARSTRDGAMIVNRSTAPVGTAHYIDSILRESGRTAKVAVNPEFLAEGRALADFLSPDRVVVGVAEPETAQVLREAYAPILDREPGLPTHTPPAAASSGPIPFVVTSMQTAELVKYAANAFLAVKISFINEIASIADELSADVGDVALAIGLDRRIGPRFLKAGIGWGGSCFPKDIVALRGMAESRGLSGRMIRAAHEVNQEQHRWVVRQLQRHLKTLVGRRIGILGLAFKPDTDDVRDAPALDIAGQLLKLSARVTAFDPAVRVLAEPLAGGIELAADPYAVARGADAVVLMTEWPLFRELDLAEMRRLMAGTLLVDGRNLFDRQAAEAAGLTYIGVGT